MKVQLTVAVLMMWTFASLSNGRSVKSVYDLNDPGVVFSVRAINQFYLKNNPTAPVRRVINVLFTRVKFVNKALRFTYDIKVRGGTFDEICYVTVIKQRQQNITLGGVECHAIRTKYETTSSTEDRDVFVNKPRTTSTHADVNPHQDDSRKTTASTNEGVNKKTNKIKYKVYLSFDKTTPSKIKAKTDTTAKPISFSGSVNPTSTGGLDRNQDETTSNPTNEVYVNKPRTTSTYAEVNPHQDDSRKTTTSTNEGVNKKTNKIKYKVYLWFDKTTPSKIKAETDTTANPIFVSGSVNPTSTGGLDRNQDETTTITNPISVSGSDDKNHDATTVGFDVNDNGQHNEIINPTSTGDLDRNQDVTTTITNPISVSGSDDKNHGATTIGFDVNDNGQHGITFIPTSTGGIDTNQDETTSNPTDDVDVNKLRTTSTLKMIHRDDDTNQPQGISTTSQSKTETHTNIQQHTTRKITTPKVKITPRNGVMKMTSDVVQSAMELFVDEINANYTKRQSRLIPTTIYPKQGNNGTTISFINVRMEESVCPNDEKHKGITSIIECPIKKNAKKLLCDRINVSWERREKDEFRLADGIKCNAVEFIQT